MAAAGRWLVGGQAGLEGGQGGMQRPEAVAGTGFGGSDAMAEDIYGGSNTVPGRFMAIGRHAQCLGCMLAFQRT